MSITLYVKVNGEKETYPISKIENGIKILRSQKPFFESARIVVVDPSFYPAPFLAWHWPDNDGQNMIRRGEFEHVIRSGMTQQGHQYQQAQDAKEGIVTVKLPNKDMARRFMAWMNGQGEQYLWEYDVDFGRLEYDYQNKTIKIHHTLTNEQIREIEELLNEMDLAAEVENVD